MAASTLPPAITARLGDQVRAAAAARRPLCIEAGGTKAFYGNPTVGERLDPRECAGIVAYEPSELVVTARAGTPLAELESALTARGQMLAFEPPHFGSHATVGGCIAAGLAGPRRAATGVASGGVRDSLLGVTLLDGRGVVLAFGGTVMKNVAGYDISRLVAGSLGTLGVVLEASLRLVPRPAAEATLSFEFDERTALRNCTAWMGMPWPVSATAWAAGRLHVRLSGATSAVGAARSAFGGELIAAEAALQFWSAIREQTAPFFDQGGVLWRLSVPANSPPLELEGPQLIEWGGALRWLHARADAAFVRRRAAELGGHATLFRGERAGIAAFTARAPAVALLERRLRAQFDPAGIFNPGRMHADQSH